MSIIREEQLSRLLHVAFGDTGSISGSPIYYARLATTAAITLSGSQVIDAVLAVAGDVVAVKNQASSAANGLYRVSTGAWQRVDVAGIGPAIIAGAYVCVELGTANPNTAWKISGDVSGWTFALLAAAGGGVPTTRVLTAGAGLTGGGDLSADRTFDVVANADASITVNANDIQVGILATDAQHGNRGGGGIHALAGAGAAGFMSAADKAKLDDIAQGEIDALPGTNGTPGAANKYVTNTDPRNTDARTPTAHATTHKSGGADVIKLDEFGAPTDVTTLNSTITQHGLCPKLGGGTTNFLRADGAWAAPPAGGAGNTGIATVDFGSNFKNDALIAVTGQAGIVGGSRVFVAIDPSQGATATHSVDEQVAIALQVRARDIIAGTGFTIHVTCLEHGGTHGTFPLSWSWS